MRRRFIAQYPGQCTRSKIESDLERSRVQVYEKGSFDGGNSIKHRFRSFPAKPSTQSEDISKAQRTFKIEYLMRFRNIAA
jgi:hypothetical protein